MLSENVNKLSWLKRLSKRISEDTSAGWRDDRFVTGRWTQLALPLRLISNVFWTSGLFLVTVECKLNSKEITSSSPVPRSSSWAWFGCFKQQRLCRLGFIRTQITTTSTWKAQPSRWTPFQRHFTLFLWTVVVPMVHYHISITLASTFARGLCLWTVPQYPSYYPVPSPFSSTIKCLCKSYKYYQVPFQEVSKPPLVHLRGKYRQG